MGHDSRVVVVNGTLVAASQRTPAHITGDERRTIISLISQESANPLRSDGYEKPISHIDMDFSLSACLRWQELQLETVPMSGQVVYLRGLESGAVPRLRAEVMRTENPECDCHIILDQQEAIETTLRNIQEGELAVLFHDIYTIVETLLRRHDAIPVATLPARPVQQPPVRVAQANVGLD